MILDADDSLDRAHALLNRLSEPERELFIKRGRSRTARLQRSTSRRSSRSPSGAATDFDSLVAREDGFALRLGNADASCFAAASGVPSQSAIEQAAVLTTHATPLRLPSADSTTATPSTLGTQHRSQELDRPLLSESECHRFLNAIPEHLADPLAQLGVGRFSVNARIDDGLATSVVVNGHGLRASNRRRATSVFAELTAEDLTASIFLGGTQPPPLQPRDLAEELVQQWMLRRDASPSTLPASTIVASPAITSALLHAFSPRLLEASVCTLGAAPGLRLMDDPFSTFGVFHGSSDGEGVPTRATTLSEAGRVCSWLRPWDVPGEVPATGCRHRDSWREPPRHRPSTLIIEAGTTDLRQEPPSETAAVLTHPWGAARVDSQGILRLRAFGFRFGVDGPSEPIRGMIEMQLDDLLEGMVAVGNDPRPTASGQAMVTPTTLLEGVALLET